MPDVVKVILNNDTLIDISDSTVEADKVLQNYVGYEGDGDRFTGSYTPPASIILSSATFSSNGTYSAPTGYAFDPVTVNVSGGGVTHTARILGDPIGNSSNLYIQHNGIKYYSYGDTITFSSGDNLYLRVYKSYQINIDASGFVAPNSYSYSAPDCDLDIWLYGRAYSLGSMHVYSVDGTYLKGIMNRQIVAISNSGMSSIGADAFRDCQLLKFTSFPSVKTISNYAFERCWALLDVSFPEAEEVGLQAFNSCSKMATADFPKVSYVWGQAFANCTSLSSINIPLLSYASSAAFKNTDIRNFSASLLASVTDALFGSCYNLETADFSIASTIGSGAFKHCKKLSSINIPNATTIGSYAFDSCSSLTKISFSLVTSIYGSAFNSCYCLESAVFPLVTSVQTTAFYLCRDLSYISFPSATFIGSWAFNACSSLESAELPLLSQIGSQTFEGCTAMSWASFPNLNSIYYSGFKTCSNLESLYLLSTSVCRLGTSVFVGTPMLNSSILGYWGSIFVPESLVSAYKTATNWTAVSNRITSYIE